VNAVYVHDLDHPHDLDDAGRRALLGGKGAGLVAMTAMGLPVPPGFTISTAAFHRFRADGDLGFLAEDLAAAMARLGARLGQGFGDPSAPLVVSVRSGAPVSMPGMMDTILDLGLNHQLAAALAERVGAGVAADAHERFVEMYTRTVGVAPPEDPWQQLDGAVRAVFDSWHSAKAATYRRTEGIPDHLGTAVTVQAMVFGTAPGLSGTGVVFTRDPSTGERVLFGDWLADAQGEDVVAGIRATEPIASLGRTSPALWAELEDVLARLERHVGDMCDVEFTVESGHLWLLQTRPGKRAAAAALRIAVELALDPDFAHQPHDAVLAVTTAELAAALRGHGAALGVPVAHGIAASPGVVSGPVVFSADAAVEAEVAGQPAILVRPETSPEDVHGMGAAAGILTALGGLVSHAAVVARAWGKVAVVGASELAFTDAGVTLAGAPLVEGDVVTLDGTTGAIFFGVADTAAATAPDAAVSTLVAWAGEIAGADAPSDPVELLERAQALASVHGLSSNPRGATHPGRG
jgi:pyruvate,orthophosphate dikinase